MDRATGVCKRAIAQFSYSFKKRDALKKAQQELKLPQHMLVTECPTRWGSRQVMIERMLEQQQAISKVLSSDKKTRHLVPTWQDVDILESLNAALKPLQGFTDVLSGEQYVSVSFVKPVLHLLKSQVLLQKEEDTELTNVIRSDIWEYLDRVYTDVETQKLLNKASLLDPRFKTEYIGADDLPDVKEGILKEMDSIIQKQMSSSSEPATSSSQSTDLSLSKKPTLGSLFRKQRNSTECDSPPGRPSENELNSYLMIANIDSEASALDWWNINRTNYPILAQLAQKYLCIPATSSPSERLFSTSGNIVTSDRTCLKPDKVNMLVFLSKNL